MDISDAELETIDQQLDEGDYDVTPTEAEDFSQDELAYEGEMDVVDQYEFEDPGVATGTRAWRTWGVRRLRGLDFD